MKPMAIEAIQITQDSLPTVAATPPMENSTSGGTPLATQNAPVQSMPRSRPALLGTAAAAAGSTAALTRSHHALKTSAQLLGDFKNISHDPIFGHPEYRCPGITVDRNDGRDVLHPRKMLNGARYAHGDIEFTCARRFSGLSDLAALGQPACVRDRPGTAEGRPDGVRKLLELRHIGFLADAAADGQDELGGGHVDIVARSRLDELAPGGSA